MSFNSAYEAQFSEVQKTEIRVGTIANDYGRDTSYITVKAELRTTKKSRMTINHEVITNPQQFSITYDAHSRDWHGSVHSCGAGVADYTADRFSKLLISEDALDALVTLAKDWHLNDMHGECIHQERGAHVDHEGETTYKGGWFTSPRYEEVTKAETLKCPYGYRYGSAWLVKPLNGEFFELAKRAGLGFRINFPEIGEQLPILNACVECGDRIPKGAEVYNGGPMHRDCAEKTETPVYE